jgi:hypothetical protein
MAKATAEQQAAEYVANRIAADRREASDRLKRVKRSLPALERRYDKAGAAFTRNPDSPLTQEVADEYENSGRTLRQAIDALRAEEAFLARLDDPAEVERRINVRLNLLDAKEARMASKTNSSSKTSKKVDTSKVGEPPVERVVEMFDAGSSLADIAKALNADKVMRVSPAGNVTKWYPVDLRDLYLAKTGLAEMPTRSKAQKPPTPARKLDKPEPKNGAKTKPEPEQHKPQLVKPDPKPAKKASTPRKRGSKAAA